MADLEQRPTGSFHPLKIDIYRLCSTIQTGRLVCPLPGCNGPGHQPPSEITTMLDHLCAYVNSNYAQAAGGMQNDQDFS